MTTRPTPERLKAMRECADSFDKELFAEIDALTAERDDWESQANAFIEGSQEWEYECKQAKKERDQWRAYAEKLKGVLQKVIKLKPRWDNSGLFYKCSDIGPVIVEAREALSLPRPGNEE